MLSTPDQAHNDPHDVLEIAPDVVLVARAEQELSRLARDAKNRSGDSPNQPKKEPPPLRTEADASPREVPVVDTSFRAAATHDGPSMARRIGRGLGGLLLAVCVGGAAVTWRASGEAAKDAIANWAPQFAAKVLPAAEQGTPAAQDTAAAESAPQSAAAPATAQDAAAPAATTPAPTTSLAASAAAAIPAPADPAQQLQSMARDVANLGQEVAVLKASLAELKASNEQMSRDMAKVSEQNQRLKISAVPARAAVPPPARKPAPTFRPTQAAAPYPPPVAPYPPQQAVAPYPPPQAGAPYPPPQAAYVPPPAQPPEDPDIPRPPMPVR